MTGPATGAAVRYGEMVTKVFFVPQGAEIPVVSDKMMGLQLATAQQRLDELQKRTAGAARRAQKEKERKLRQKAAKKAGQQELARWAQQQATTQAATQAQCSTFPGISNLENQTPDSQNNQKWENSHFLTVKSSFCLRMQTLQIAANLRQKAGFSKFSIIFVLNCLILVASQQSNHQE